MSLQKENHNSEKKKQQEIFELAKNVENDSIMEDNENSESQRDSHMEPVVTKVFEADNHYHFVCKSSTTKNDSEDMDA